MIVRRWRAVCFLILKGKEIVDFLFRKSSNMFNCSGRKSWTLLTLRMTSRTDSCSTALQSESEKGCLTRLSKGAQCTILISVSFLTWELCQFACTICQTEWNQVSMSGEFWIAFLLASPQQMFGSCFGSEICFCCPSPVCFCFHMFEAFNLSFLLIRTQVLTFSHMVWWKMGRPCQSEDYHEFLNTPHSNPDFLLEWW